MVLYGSEYLPTALVRHQVFASNGAAEVLAEVVATAVEIKVGVATELEIVVVSEVIGSAEVASAGTHT